MPVSIQDGWVLGDAVAVPAEGLYTWESPELGTRILMPVKAITDRAFPYPVLPERCKLCRRAAANYARSRWGPAAKPEPWKPTAKFFDPARLQVEALLGHRFWERFDVIGSLVHLALPTAEAAVTIDLVVRFLDGGLGLLAIWTGPRPAEPQREIPNTWLAKAQESSSEALGEAVRLYGKTLAQGAADVDLLRAPWAEMGAAVAAFADAGIPVAKAIVIWVQGEQIKLEARPPQDALALWVDAVSLARAKTRGHGVKRLLEAA